MNAQVGKFLFEYQYSGSTSKCTWCVTKNKEEPKWVYMYFDTCMSYWEPEGC